MAGESTPHSQLTRGTLPMLAAACGITVGNVYLCQPLLDQMAVSLRVPEQTAGLVAVAAQVGYALGILFVLPLADVIASRRLVRTLLVLTSLFLLAAAFSSRTSLLAAASVALTASTVVPQILIPIVSGMTAPEHRGRTIGALQTGLILGILLSRTASGSLAQVTGTWRSPYLLAAVLTGLLVLIVPRLIPERETKPRHTGYLGLLRSLPPLLQHRPLRLSMTLGFLVFGAFSALWATLAFYLAGPDFGFGPATAGLFGLYGAPGAILAPMAGRLSDRVGSSKINLVSLAASGIALALAGWLGGGSLLILVVAVNLLDFGLQSGQIANQTRILGLGDDIRARLNTLYMAATFGGGAAGSFAGTLAWSFGGWTSACGLSLALIAAAASTLVLNWKNEYRSSHMKGE
ncbi:MFS transporter [Rhizobium leguminosarum]|uniref:MFS transporter n=1 Tax=Rhizobium ruizarguesonis TaxID=2081791 RepID=UPI0013BE42D7|nr:MFS transporter [Rhizobium ruizarguesonis]NEI16068.1 MFS transporter [Rhizobium ruizarguesonis]